MSNIWKVANEKQFELVKKFKTIFIDQLKNNIDEIFSKEFGVHNGYSVSEYCDYEFNEFALKSDKFELTHEAKIECFEIGNNYLYFSLGKKNDRAVFESIFLWDEKEGKLKGNQYPYKIEPKIQFYKNMQNGEITFNRRMNIKAPVNEMIIKNVLISQNSHDFIFFKQDLDDIFGGVFYSLLYQDDEENLHSYWNKVTIFADKSSSKNLVLMRGKDHPLFIDDLFPEMVSLNEFKIKDEIYPVVINIEFEDGTDILLKYPLEKNFKFDKTIRKVCLTDTLSFDWIVKNIEDKG